MTRQAVTKHFRILEDAEFVTQEIRGREHLFTARLSGIEAAQWALRDISQLWDDALNRLKNLVENTS